MSTSWLNKHRKQALLDLSSEAGLPQYVRCTLHMLSLLARPQHDTDMECW